MNYASLLKSAVKGSAPIVAIPIEGKAPFIVRTRRLKGWVKGVKVERVEVRQNPDVIEYRRPRLQWVHELRQSVQPEGPEERVAVKQPRWLEIEGRPEKNQTIRCSAKFRPIPRHEAIEELGKWADKERERQTKKRNLGALGLTAKERKEMARARYEEDAEGMVTVMCWMKKHPNHILGSSKRDQETHRSIYTCSCGQWREGLGSEWNSFQLLKKAHSEHAGRYKEPKQGIPAVIPECPELEFVLVRWGDHNEDNVQFTITETITGRSAGSGKTAIEALAKARGNWRKLPAERREEMVGKIRQEKPILT